MAEEVYEVHAWTDRESQIKWLAQEAAKIQQGSDLKALFSEDLFIWLRARHNTSQDWDLHKLYVAAAEESSSLMRRVGQLDEENRKLRADLKVSQDNAAALYQMLTKTKRIARKYSKLLDVVRCAVQQAWWKGDILQPDALRSKMAAAYEECGPLED
jgi:uncharacterized protein YhaN